MFLKDYYAHFATQSRQQREEIRQKHEKEGMLFNRQKPPLPPESPAPKRSYAKPQMQRNPSRTSNSVNLRTIKLLRSAAEPRATEHTWGDHGGPSPIESIEDLKNASIDDVNSEKINSRMQELWQPLPILPDEEAERLEGLQQRERFMRSIGLIEAIHRLLYNSRGVTSSTLAKDANFGKLLHKKNDPSSECITNFGNRSKELL